MADSNESFMQQAVALAQQGEGSVEPNPMVGCVLVRDNQIIGRGFHEEFGGPHAEVNAINDAVANGHTDLSNATAYVTLEPCSHVGKTGPCSQALIDAKVSKVVVACKDPNPKVGGQGIEQLRAAKIEVEVGVLESESRFVLAPYLKKMQTGLPWIVAKWAMTLDGKIASHAGDSKWISSEASRAIVHEIRGRVDGVMVGIGTALADDPGLDARYQEMPLGSPAAKRTAKRIVVDSSARLPLDSKLVRTANEIPVLVAVGPTADAEKCKQLRENGVEVFKSDSSDPNERLRDLLKYLGEQGLTNVLVEGGGKLLGSLNDQDLVDEVHVFIGTKIIGGSEALSPVEGVGFELMKQSSQIQICSTDQVDGDIYIMGRVGRRN